MNIVTYICFVSDSKLRAYSYANTDTDRRNTLFTQFEDHCVENMVKSILDAVYKKYGNDIDTVVIHTYTVEDDTIRNAVLKLFPDKKITVFGSWNNSVNVIHTLDMLHTMEVIV